MQEQFNMKGKIAIVSGASKGIGKAMAIAFAEAGAQVIVSSRKLEAVEEVAKEIRDMGKEAQAFAANMGSEEDINALVEFCNSSYGGIDVIVNNAAANPVFGPILQTENWAFDKIMNVNVKGPFLLAKAAFPIMSKRGNGSIINISSVGGISPEPLLGIYSVSKTALISLTKVMAKEWGASGIRANVICPGLIKTKFSKALWQDESNLNGFLKHQPLPRIGIPEDVSGLALFLASDASSYCTGGVYTVDGGYTI